MDVDIDEGAGECEVCSLEPATHYYSFGWESLDGESGEVILTIYACNDCSEELATLVETAVVALKENVQGMRKRKSEGR